MNVQQLTSAIIDGINGGGEGFMEGTLAAALPVIWLMILGLQIGQPYIIDMIGRFTLRLGADMLWLVYVGVRDILIVTGFVMSFMFFFPDVVTGNDLPLTGGLAAACLFGILLVKLTGDPDQNLRDFRMVMGLLGVGSVLYFVPYVFGVQANAIAPDGWMKSTSDFLVTSSNQGLAVPLTYVAIAIVAVLGAAAAAYTLRTGGRAETEQAATGD